MAAVKFSRLARSLNSSLNFANGIDVRSSFACLNRSYHASDSHSSRDYAARCFWVVGLSSASQRQCIGSSYLSRPLDNWALRSVSFGGSIPAWSLRLYSSSVGGKGNTPGGSDPAISESGMGAGGSDGGEWVLKAREAWQGVVDAVNSTGEKAKEASSEMTPYVQQMLDAHPYLRDVIAPVSGTLLCTLLAWVVMPRFLRRFHKISMEGPATLLSQSSLWKPVPYEESIWGALESPVRYLITFMAFTQIAAMVAPTSIASHYIIPAWKCAVILSSVWFLQRWKTNVISRALAGKSIESGDRDRLLTLERISSVGLFAIGIMGLAEACGVPVQSILTVGGVGGIATAFAARDVIGNILSGLSLQISRPFTIGDTIKAGSVEGQVVEMGMTTTSLLTAEKFPVIVPNSLFTSQVIVNKSRAQWRALATKVPLHIEDFEKIPQISEDIKNMLKSYPNVFLEKEVPYCFLSKLERTYAELTLGCNLKYMSKDKMFSTEQDILLQAARIIKQHGATLADLH
nr:mechanosensitive ion channel protein 1, mitochondrial-like [Ipomoea trifida]